jgi:hypothetical protein
MQTVELLAMTLLLQRDLGLSIPRSLNLAGRLQAQQGEVQLGVLASLHFDLARLRSVLQQALAAAVEDHIEPRRGRPRSRGK